MILVLCCKHLTILSLFLCSKCVLAKLSLLVVVIDVWTLNIFEAVALQFCLLRDSEKGDVFAE